MFDVVLLTDHIHVSLFLDSLFCFVDPCVCFYANYCFDYYSFVIRFEIRESNAISFVLSQDLAIKVFSISTQILGLYFCEQNSIGILIGYTESVDCFGWYGHFNSINSSSP